MNPSSHISRRFQILLPLCALLTAASGWAADTWTGLGTDNNWMTAGNWNPATTPLTNDTLIFTGMTQLANNNNFPAGSTFNGITFDANAGAFTLSGNSITPGSGLTDSSAAVETVALNIVLGAAHSFNVGLAGGDLVISGVISGGNSISQTGPGTLTLTGGNTFTGGITAIAGTLTVSGNGTLGAGNYAGAIVNSGNFNYTGVNSQNLTGAISNGGTITFNTAGAMNVTGAITGPGTINQDGAGTVTFGAALNVGAITVTQNGSGSVTIGASSSVGALAVGTGASVAFNVNTSPAQWTTSNLTFAAGSTSLSFNFTQTPNAVTAPLQVNGNVALNGSLGISISATAVPISAGDYPLIAYTGSLSGAPLTTPAALPAGVTGTIFNNTANHSIDLLVPAGNGNQVTWATGSGVWNTTTPNWNDGSSQDYADGDFALFQDSLSGASPITVTLNSTVNPAGVTFDSSKNLTLSGTGGIGNGSLTQQGSGTLTITATNMQYTGTTSINDGTLDLDFNTFGVASGGTLSNNIINPSSALSFGGGMLDINGSTALLATGSETTNIQEFASTAFTAGNSEITFSGGTNAILELGTMTATLGATVVINGVASMSNGIAGGTLVPGTGIIEASSTAGPVGLVGNTTTFSGYATVGAYDWAAISAGQVVGGATITGFYTPYASGNNAIANNADITGSSGSHNTDSGISVRFNTPGAITFNLTSIIDGYGILVTPNVGPNNVTITANSGESFEAERNGANRSPVIWQNNTNGLLIMIAPIDNTSSSPDMLTEAGPGTVVYNSATANATSFTGQTYLNGGVAEVFADNGLGAAATGATVFLNGGTVLAGTFTMDNSGANKRPFVLGVNGGGLAAVSNAVVTVDGVIGSSVGTGPLSIGIPASSANGFVAGLVPGTGANTANPATNASGTVILTGVNTYSGGTIIDSGTLNFVGGSLGLGGVTFNGGALQWSAGNTSDISSRTVTLGAGGGTVNLNGQNVTLANSIGNAGSGALTLTNGTLTLQGANTYTGGTTVGAGATLIAANTSGSATGTGPVTVQSGATLAGPGTMNGAVTVLGGAVFAPAASGVGTLQVGSLNLASGSLSELQFNSTPANSQIVVANSGGLTLSDGSQFSLGGLSAPGIYNLIQFSGSIGGSGLDATWTTPSDANVHVNNANGAYVYSFGSSGGYLTLTVANNTNSVIATWTNNANGAWSTLVDWNPNRVPHSPGDDAIFGASAGLRTVTLDVNESVGALSFTNANSFIIAGSGAALTIDNNGAPAAINVTAGAANAIQTGVSLNSTAAVNVGSGDYLGISGSVSNQNNSAPQTVLAEGAGTLALSGNNSYGPAAGSFGTTLTGGGTLQVGSASALGASDLAVTGNGTLQAGSSVSLANNIDIAPTVNVTVDTQANNLALSGALSDSGHLTKIGSGTLTLGGDSVNFTGAATVDAGTISISVDSNLGADSTLVLNGGGLAGTGAVSLNRNINVGPALGPVGTNAYLDATGSGSLLEINGAIGSSGNTGVNNLTVNGHGGTGTVELQGADPFAGTTIIAAGVLDVANAGALENSTLFYNNQGGVLIFDGGVNLTAATFGGLSGDQNLILTNAIGSPVALTVGGDNASTIYSGDLNDGGTGGSLAKSGAGTLTLTGVDSYTGTTTVNLGILEIPTGGVLSVGVLNGGGYLVDGGFLTNGPTTVSSLAQINNTLLETAGTVMVGEITQANNDAFQMQVNGGVFSAVNVALGRSFNYGTTTPTATTPIAAQTANGFWIDSTNTLQPARVYLGQLTIGITAANSSTSLRLDAGSVTVTNEVLLGDTSNTRFDVMQINGGNFTNLDTTNGITMSINDGANGNNSELYLSGGNTYAGILNFGAMADSIGGAAVVFVDGGNLWMGSGGIELSNAAGLEPIIYLESGILGATANWSSTMLGDGQTFGFFLPIAGNSFTIQAADPNNVPYNISFIGSGLGGAGNLVKTGGGTLTLGGANLFTGSTTVSAGTLALAGDGVTTGVLLGTSGVNIISPGVVSTAGLPDGALHLGDSLVGEGIQSLSGNGMVAGNVTIGATGTLAPGISPASFGNFTVAGNLTNAGALLVKVDHPGAGATNDTISAQAITNLAGATLIVTQGTNSLRTGDVFKLFNIADGNNPTNLAITLPATSPDATIIYVWNTNSLAGSGTITLTSGAAPVPTTPTNMTFSVSGGVLHISWPASYLGWSLQSNSVSLNATNDWFTISGSSSVTSENITLPVAGSVFFRMYYNN